MIVVLALTLTVLGCACLYLANPNQKWLSLVPPRRPLLAVGSLLLIAGLAAWIAALRPLVGFFVALHVAMVCLFAFPYSAALLRRKS
ncbi:putative membrane-anchored protein [Bradyrhizobium sp. AZCC 1719]|uniref:hypothetical protein n=1 Tax=Bradyrhizobium sp. AZCC 1719 TaxID=3117028 RepID=UPI002FF00A31